MSTLNESMVEYAALTWFGELGYALVLGLHLSAGEPAAERDSFGEVVLVGRLREAIRRMNGSIPEEARATIRPYRIVRMLTGREITS